MDELFADAEERMDKAVEAVRREFAKIRSGKATVSLLDGVRVEYYGSTVPLRQIANISVPEARLLVVQPWDKKTVGDIEKAILQADLGLNPSNDGKLIRVPIPPLTEERRKQLVKKVRALGEEAKTAIRQIRRDANDEIKQREKDSVISEDEARRQLDETQKDTNQHTEQIDKLCQQKEKELMEIA